MQNINLIKLFMHLKFCSVNGIMAPQRHQIVCVNASKTTSDAASVSSAANLQFLIILTELI